MKYYSLKLKLWDDSVLDDRTKDPKVYPRANGDRISNNNGFLTTSGNFGKIYFENYVDEAPVFDYFYLYNLTSQKEYDWILLDAYDYIGQNIPSCRGFLVSKKFKETLERFEIAKPFRFYESRLMYQGEKLEYYIFHLAQNEWNEFNPKLSSFHTDGQKLEGVIKGNRELKKILRIHPNVNMKIHLNELFDIFFFAQFGYVISENLKTEIEKMGLNDFEFIKLENVDFSQST